MQNNATLSNLKQFFERFFAYYGIIKARPNRRVNSTSYSSAGMTVATTSSQKYAFEGCSQPPQLSKVTSDFLAIWYDE